MPKKKRKSRKKPRKGFTRSTKAWEESIATHIGHIIDNSSIDDIFNVAIYSLCGYFGYKIGGIGGAATGLVGYKLANVPNSHLSNGVGLGILGAIGLLNVRGHLTQEQAENNLRDRGYSDEEINQMHNFALETLKEFHPFG